MLNIPFNTNAVFKIKIHDIYWKHMTPLSFLLHCKNNTITVFKHLEYTTKQMQFKTCKQEYCTLLILIGVTGC